MYGTGSAQSASVGNLNVPQAVQESTLLEEHLRVLRGHLTNGREVVDRLERIADRLVGAVPQPIGKDGQAKDAGEPPLVTRIDHTGRDLTGLFSQIHEQISRLERL